MTHRATRRFRDCYHRLPPEVRRLADGSYALLEADPSLHFKRVGRLLSVRVGPHGRPG